MRATRKLSKIGLLVVMFAFLAGGSEAAFAKGAVTINVAKGGAPPKVFIVSESAKGELARTPVSAEGTRVEVPDGARVEIVNADPSAMIKVEGNVEVAVQGGFPALQLSGDVLLNVGAQVEQMHVMVESGSPSVISHGGTTSLAAGQQVALAIVNNELNVRPIEAFAAPEGVPGAGQQGFTGSFPGALQGFGGAPQGTGQATGGLNFAQATPTGFGSGVLARSALDPVTGLSQADISLLNSLSLTGQTPPGTTVPVTGPTDPFALGTFPTTDTTALATITGTATTFDPTAYTTATSTETFVAQTESNTTTSTTEPLPTASPSS